MVLIYLLIFLVAVFILLAVLAYIVPLKLCFILDSGRMDAHVSASWLRQLEIKAEMLELRPHISVFLFKRQIISKYPQKSSGGKGRAKKAMSALELEDTGVKIRYGFSLPHFTGLLCTVLDFICSLVRVDRLELYPEFFSAEDYLQIEADAKLNIGKTVANMIVLKSNKTKRKKEKRHGSVNTHSEWSNRKRRFPVPQS